MLTLSRPVVICIELRQMEDLKVEVFVFLFFTSSNVSTYKTFVSFVRIILFYL